MTRRWFVNILFPILVLFSIAPVWAYEETTMQNFLVKEGVLISVSNIQGKVVMEGHAENVVNMTATKSVEGVSEEKARELFSRVGIKTEADESAVRITTDLSGTFLSTFLTWQTPKVDYLLAVPYTARVNVETVSGEVNITNLQGETEVKTVSGRITLQGLAGKVNLETVSGKITIDRLLGNLTARTISGPVDVDIPLSNDFLEVSLSSVSGNITVFLHQKEEVKIIVETVSGRFTSEIPLEIHEGGSFGRRTFEGQTSADPRKTITIKTISGNVSLKKFRGESI
ncbi:MAG: DUF4097 family beta strand repeat protein [Candidatus Atribacteria bacterium]|nr:DUF4097 family beta strand repeat protein [Candidatus Atribacteria bacterium]